MQPFISKGGTTSLSEQICLPFLIKPMPFAEQAIELDQFLKSVFLDMFGDPISEGFKILAMTDVFDITTGS